MFYKEHRKVKTGINHAAFFACERRGRGVEEGTQENALSKLKTITRILTEGNEDKAAGARDDKRTGSADRG